MVNLLTETLEKLKHHGKSTHDIQWIGSYDGAFEIKLEDFLSIANKEYDGGYGSAEVNGSLVIVGKDWWLERGEYDGSEWWEFKKLPVLSENPKPATSVFRDSYEDTWE